MPEQTNAHVSISTNLPPIPEDWASGCYCPTHRGEPVGVTGYVTNLQLWTRWAAPECPKHGDEAPRDPDTWLAVIHHPEYQPAGNPGLDAIMGAAPRETSYTVTRTTTKEG